MMLPIYAPCRKSAHSMRQSAGVAWKKMSARMASPSLPFRGASSSVKASFRSRPKDDL